MDFFSFFKIIVLNEHVLKSLFWLSFIWNLKVFFYDFKMASIVPSDIKDFRYRFWVRFMRFHRWVRNGNQRLQYWNLKNLQPCPFDHFKKFVMNLYGVSICQKWTTQHPFTPSHFIARIDNIKKSQNHLHIVFHHHLEHEFFTHPSKMHKKVC
jgi:hypothetical protein